MTSSWLQYRCWWCDSGISAALLSRIWLLWKICHWEGSASPAFPCRSRRKPCLRLPVTKWWRSVSKLIHFLALPPPLFCLGGCPRSLRVWCLSSFLKLFCLREGLFIIFVFLLVQINKPNVLISSHKTRLLYYLDHHKRYFHNCSFFLISGEVTTAGQRSRRTHNRLARSSAGWFSQNERAVRESIFFSICWIWVNLRRGVKLRIEYVL